MPGAPNLDVRLTRSQSGSILDIDFVGGAAACPSRDLAFSLRSLFFAPSVRSHGPRADRPSAAPSNGVLLCCYEQRGRCPRADGPAAEDPRAPRAQGGDADKGERRAGGGARRLQPPPLHPQGRRPRPPRQPNTRFQPTAARVAPLRERPPGEADLDVRAAPRGRDGRRRAPGLGHLQAPHHLALVAPRQAALPHPGKRHTHTPPALFRSL